MFSTNKTGEHSHCFTTWKIREGCNKIPLVGLILLRPKALYLNIENVVQINGRNCVWFVDNKILYQDGTCRILVVNGVCLSYKLFFIFQALRRGGRKGACAVVLAEHNHTLLEGGGGGGAGVTRGGGHYIVYSIQCGQFPWL